MGTFEPRESCTQLCDPIIDLARLDHPVTTYDPSPRGIARNGRERQRFVAAFYSALNIAPLYLSRSHPRPADHLKPEVVEGDAAPETATAITKASLPVAEAIRDRGHMSEGLAGHPAIAARLEA